MNIDNILSYSENNMSDAEESAFFAHLAQDRGMRESFKDHLRIKYSSAFVNQGYAGDATVTSSLFSAIGLSYGDTGESVGPVEEPYKPVGSFAGSPIFYEGAIAATLVAAVFLAIFLFSNPLSDDAGFALGSESEEVLESSIEDKQPELKSYPAASSRLNTQAVDQSEYDRLSKENSLLATKVSELEEENSDITNRYSVMKSAYEREIDGYKTNISQISQVSQASRVNSQSESFVEPTNLYITRWEQPREQNMPEPMQSFSALSYPASGYGDVNSIDSENDGLLGMGFLQSVGVEYKNFHYWNVGDVTMAPSDPPAFNNESLSLVFTIIDNTDIILDARRENFSLQFTGVEDGRATRFETYPNFETFSLGVRQRISLSEEFDVFGQGMYGFNSLAPVTRLGAGFTFKPFDYMSLIAGYEYSYMGFDFQGENFGSSKNGMYYGIMLNL
jgi:hypothetical protein